VTLERKYTRALTLEFGFRAEHSDPAISSLSSFPVRRVHLQNDKPAAASPLSGPRGSGKGDKAVKARGKEDAWCDGDPWSDAQKGGGGGGSRGQVCIGVRRGRGRMDGVGAGMRAPCTPSSLSLEQRLKSPPGKPVYICVFICLLCEPTQTHTHTHTQVHTASCSR
jgi:hypothetical protein